MCIFVILEIEVVLIKKNNILDKAYHKKVCTIHEREFCFREQTISDLEPKVRAGQGPRCLPE